MNQEDRTLDGGQQPVRVKAFGHRLVEKRTEHGEVNRRKRRGTRSGGRLIEPWVERHERASHFLCRFPGACESIPGVSLGPARPLAEPLLEEIGSWLLQDESPNPLWRVGRRLDGGHRPQGMAHQDARLTDPVAQERGEVAREVDEAITRGGPARFPVSPSVESVDRPGRGQCPDDRIPGLPTRRRPVQQHHRRPSGRALRVGEGHLAGVEPPLGQLRAHGLRHAAPPGVPKAGYPRASSTR